MLSAQDVIARYPTGWELGPLSLRVQPGEWIAVLGANGSGKSTLLKTLAHLIPATAGRVECDELLASDAEPQAWAKKIAWVDSNATALFPFTVEEMVLMGRTPHQTHKWSTEPSDRAAVEWALGCMDLLPLRQRSVQHLSSGERQRVWVARGLAQDASYLLLDEPQAHLDVAHSWNLFKTLTQLRHDRPFAMIAALHDLHLAATYFDRFLLIKDGKSLTAAPVESTQLPEFLNVLYGDGMPSALYDLDLLNKLRRTQKPPTTSAGLSIGKVPKS